VEKLVRQLTCDYCKRKENVSAIGVLTGLLDWRKIKPSGMTLHFCSNRCERKYLEKCTNTDLKRR